MKHKKWIILFTFSTLLLSSCFWWTNQEVTYTPPVDNIVEEVEETVDEKSISEYTNNIGSSSDEKIKNAFELSQNWDYENAMQEWIDIYKTSNGKNEKVSNGLMLAFTYLNYGNYYYKESEYAQKALTLLDELWIDEDNFYALYYRGYAHEIIREYEKALEYYNKALELESATDLEMAIMYNQIGHLHSLQWDAQKAYEMYLKAHEKDNENVNIKMNLARVLMRLRLWEQALEYYGYVIENTSNTFIKAEVYYNVSSYYFYSWVEDSLKLALFNAAQSVQANDKYPFGHLAVWKALYFMWWNNFDEAQKALNKSIELHPNSFYAYETLWLIEIDKKQYTQAIQKLTKALMLIKKDIALMWSETQSNLSRVNYYLAIAYAGKWDKQKALDLLENMIQKGNTYALLLFTNELQKENHGKFSTLVWEEKFTNMLSVFTKK